MHEARFKPIEKMKLVDTHSKILTGSGKFKN